MKNLSSIADIPLHQSTNDFGTEQYVQGLVRFISHSAAPITIALQGEWGSGKTSLMNRLCNDLCSKGKDFIGININTWEYSMLATPEETVIKIIAQLVRELSGSDPESQSQAIKLLKGVVRVGWRFAREALKGVNPTVGKVVEGLGVASDIEFGEDRVTLHDLKEALTLSIKKSIGDTKKGIVVFVDDLDRLNPPLAVQILELLKNIFTLDHCIFILAIDYDVVVKGLEPKFGPLSSKNEREFRSFFDKIIQVPFHLPVSNYQPKNFVLDSLESIGYFTHVERENSYIESNVVKIVDSSVGKNPRSIKRLINTLSLNDCIARCSSKESENDSLEAKIINFAFVAIQVCFPKIYDLLVINPIFEKWDRIIASKLNLHLDKGEMEDINGAVILDALCLSDAYFEKNQANIEIILDVISENIPPNVDDREGYLRNILKKSASTNIVPTTEVVELDRKALINKLHDNVWDYIRRKRPEIHGKPKNNTGNGGFKIYLPDDNHFDVIFRPTQAKGKIVLDIFLWTQIGRPERLKGKDYEDVIADEEVMKAVRPLNETVKRLCHQHLRESRTFFDKNNDYMFDNLVDEFIFRKGELWGSISGNVNYYINQKSPSNFEDKRIIETIGDLIIAAYELNVNAQMLG